MSAARLSQCDRILAFLADGEPHTMTRVHQAVGFCRLNSRVSELRKRGHRIECWRDGADYVYRLVSLGEGPSSRSDGSSPSETVPLAQDASLSSPAQVSLDLWSAA